MKTPLPRIDTTGATDGDVPIYNGSSGDLEFGPLTPATIWIPLTAVTAGVPSLVWDSSFNLVLTEVPAP